MSQRPILRPFLAEDLLAFRNRDTLDWQGWRLAMEKERGPVAYTAVVGEEVIGCAGIIIPWPGFAVVWAEFDKKIEAYPIWLTRIVRRVMEDAIRAYGLHRLEAVVRADNGRNARWIEALGFSRENGCARAYAPDGANGIRYELVGPEVEAQAAPGGTISAQPIPQVGG